MKFYNFLNEFKRSSDSDYPASSKLVVIWDENDDYKKKGKTHALASHAIKHGDEFFPSEFERIIYGCLKYILTTEDYTLINKKGNTVDSKITNDVVVNTLDRINDKKMRKEKLTKEESYIYKNFISELKNLYNNKFEEFINSSIDITDFEYLEEIMTLWGRNMMLRTNGKHTLFFNVQNYSFAMREKKKGRSTMYKMRSADKLKDKLMKFEYNNPVVMEFINNIK